MTVRLAYVYVLFLFVLETLLMGTSLLMHMSVLWGAAGPYAIWGTPLFRASVIVGALTAAFIEDRARWIDQVKSCPKWMWKGALILGIYAVLIAGVQTLVSGGTFFEEALTVSGFPLGFDAISICILHTVLFAGYLEKSEVLRRAVYSVGFVVVAAAILVAHRAGYFHHQTPGER